MLNLEGEKSFEIECLKKFGDVAQYALPVFMGGYAIYRGKIEEGLSLALMGLIQKIEMSFLKKFFPKNRPEPVKYGQVSPKDKESFPSSHTGGAFLGAGFTIGLYGLKDPLSITMIALASLVGASRVLSKRHWMSDVAAGALIGTINGFLASQSLPLKKVPFFLR